MERSQAQNLPEHRVDIFLRRAANRAFNRLFLRRVAQPGHGKLRETFLRIPFLGSVGHCDSRVIFFLVGERIRLGDCHEVPPRPGSGLLFSIGRQRHKSNDILMRGLMNEMQWRRLFCSCLWGPQLAFYSLLYGFELINHFKAKFYLMTEIENEALRKSHVNLAPFSVPVDAK